MNQTIMKPNSQSPASQHYVYLLTFAYAVSTFASGILMPIYAFFVQKIGGGILETSWAVALYSILYGLGTILIHQTPWSHKHRMHFLWLGWLMWLVSMALYFIMTNVTMLYLAQVLQALGDAMYEPVFDAEFSEQVATNPSGGWAFFNGTTSIFSGVASVAGGLIATTFGFDTLLCCVVAIGTISFFLILYYIQNNGTTATQISTPPINQAFQEPGIKGL